MAEEAPVTMHDIDNDNCADLCPVGRDRSTQLEFADGSISLRPLLRRVGNAAIRLVDEIVESTSNLKGRGYHR